jgi:uncharacterized protein YgbK (DUF1537 family)
MKYIIADDLSGANDTGVKFAKKGYNAVVSITTNQSTLLIPDKIDVFVVDTETRELEERPARKKVLIKMILCIKKLIQQCGVILVQKLKR